MTDHATEWLESLYALNAPEADMARELLDRLLEADAEQEAEIVSLTREADTLQEQLGDLCEALGAEGVEEAIAMARTLREAFE